MNWWKNRRRRGQCTHGKPRGESFVSGQLIDLGRRKMFTCSACDKRWIG